MLTPHPPPPSLSRSVRLGSLLLLILLFPPNSWLLKVRARGGRHQGPCRVCPRQRHLRRPYRGPRRRDLGTTHGHGERLQGALALPLVFARPRPTYASALARGRMRVRLMSRLGSETLTAPLSSPPPFLWPMQNAKDMIGSLQMKYNRGRQAVITNELCVPPLLGQTMDWAGKLGPSQWPVFPSPPLLLLRRSRQPSDSGPRLSNSVADSLPPSFLAPLSLGTV